MYVLYVKILLLIDSCMGYVLDLAHKVIVRA